MALQRGLRDLGFVMRCERDFHYRAYISRLIREHSAAAAAAPEQIYEPAVSSNVTLPKFVQGRVLIKESEGSITA